MPGIHSPKITFGRLVMRKRNALLAVFSLAMGGCFVAARAGDPQVRPGFGELQFSQGVNAPGGFTFGPTLVDEIIPEPFYNWTFTDSELTGRPASGQLGLLALDDAIHPIMVRYRSTNTTFQDQDEILMFTRDPEEHFRSLFGVGISSPPNGGDSTRFRALLGSTVLPNVPAMTYPPSNIFTPGDFRTEQLKPTDFWTVMMPTGPGAVPASFGSVKTAKAIHHGVCSQEIPYLNVMMGGTIVTPGLLDTVNDGIASAATMACAGADVLRIYSNAVPYLHQTTDRDEAGGGFVFQTQYDFTIHAPFATSVVPGYEVAYEWRLLDGILEVEPTRSSVGYKIGTGFDQLRQLFDDLFLSALNAPNHVDLILGSPRTVTTLAETVYQAANEQQQYRFPGVPPISPAGFFTGTIPCAQAPVGMIATTDEVPIASGVCSAFLSSLANTATGNVNLVSPPLTIDEVARIKASMGEAVTSSLLGVPVFKNVHCRNETQPAMFGDPTSVTTISICEYNVRAKRVNVYPDKLELVWLDDDREVANPVYPIFLLDKIGATAGAGPALCTRQPEFQLAVRPRAYSTSVRNFLNLCP
jgi:hypothetical protein